ncbi:MAG: hypothetical protein U0529_02085 [Thermoanaerobaculia bacterium]
MRTNGSNATRGGLSTWLGLAILVAGLLNGIGPYLRRTGLIERDLYETFWTLHTGPGGFTRAPFGLGRRCVTHRPASEGGTAVEGGGPPARYVFAIRRWEIPCKALKDLLVLALVVGSVVAALRGRSALVPLARSWPALALAALVAWQAAAGLVRGQPLETVAGLRAFAFLGIAVAAGWVTDERLRGLVPWLLALLGFQLLLAPLEFLRGIPVQGHMGLFGELFARRAAGTFVMPNTLGLFAACVVALAAGFGATTRLRVLAWFLGGLAVVASGSASGLVVLGATGLVVVASAGRRRRVVALALLLAALAAGSALLVSGRPDVADSVSARVGGIGRLLEGSASDVLLGRQLGLGTNAARQLGGARGDAEAGGGAGESGIAALVLQAGLVGLALFAAALGLAFARNTPARPLVLALALAGLVLNVPEAFPLNLLLGFVLALPRPFPLASSPLPA